MARYHQIPAIVCGSFVLLGTTWVLVTDVLVYYLVSDPLTIARLETAKGWAFVGFTAVVLYWVTRWSVQYLARSEATMRGVVESIADGVLIVGRDRKIASANPAAVAMLGAASSSELVGTGPIDFARRFHVSTPAGRIGDPADYISARALAGARARPYKAQLFPPDRPPLTIISTAAPVRLFPGGPVELSVSVMHDVTEIEGLDRMRDEFFSAAAHALKTPVAIIQAHVDLAGARGRPADLAAIARQCGKLDRLTENILVLVRLRSSTLRFYPDEIDCAEVIDAVAYQMRDASSDHGLVTRIDGHPKVFADPDRVAQVVRNLIEIAYRRARTRTDVVLRIEEVEGCARIRVVYEPVERDRPSSCEDDPGYAGLGLECHIVDLLVAATAGTTHSEREPDGTCSDWVEIPTIAGAPRG
ncbi:MAG: histidine kinase dimerization/phospho-acceptor domain-containing protein [Kofleriaceae bacterium]